MISLVGYTGFVGSNIYESGRNDISGIYNSRNIEDAYHTKPDILIYSGMRAEKFLANTNPTADMALVEQAEKNISEILPHRLVLISTIDVFRNSVGKTEKSEIEENGLQTYGFNRYKLEQWAREHYSDALIIRLPGLYGRNIKKNYIYDYINIIPQMLNQTKFSELRSISPEIEQFYDLCNNGFYKCRILSDNEKKYLKDIFRKTGFTALNFTDSRSVYQFYPLSRLWSDIQIALKHELTIWHPATEPVSAGTIYQYLTGKKFVNEISDSPAYYDYRTVYANLFGGENGYIMNRESVLGDIRRFVEDTQ